MRRRCTSTGMMLRPASGTSTTELLDHAALSADTIWRVPLCETSGDTITALNVKRTLPSLLCCWRTATPVQGQQAFQSCSFTGPNANDSKEGCSPGDPFPLTAGIWRVRFTGPILKDSRDSKAAIQKTHFALTARGPLQ